MDEWDEDGPGAIPAVKHIDFPMEVPSVASEATKREEARKEAIRKEEEKKEEAEANESPFDEETKKEVQLKELDDIVAMISVADSEEAVAEPYDCAPSYLPQPILRYKMEELVQDYIEVSDVSTDEEDGPSKRAKLWKGAPAVKIEGNDLTSYEEFAPPQAAPSPKKQVSIKLPEESDNDKGFERSEPDVYDQDYDFEQHVSAAANCLAEVGAMAGEIINTIEQSISQEEKPDASVEDEEETRSNSSSTSLASHTSFNESPNEESPNESANEEKPNESANESASEGPLVAGATSTRAYDPQEGTHSSEKVASPRAPAPPSPGVPSAMLSLLGEPFGESSPGAPSPGAPSAMSSLLGEPFGESSPGAPSPGAPSAMSSLLGEPFGESSPGAPSAMSSLLGAQFGESSPGVPSAISSQFGESSPGAPSAISSHLGESTITSLLGEHLEDKDEDNADRELDFSRNNNFDDADEDATYAAVIAVPPSEEDEEEGEEDEQLEEEGNEVKEGEYRVEDAILGNAAFSAALLGIGPENDSDEELLGIGPRNATARPKFVEMPSDEFLEAPEGADLPETGATRRAPSYDDFQEDHSATDSLSNSSDVASLLPMAPENMVPEKHVEKKEDMNVSLDHTVMTEINTSRDDGYLMDPGLDGHPIDEEQPHASEKTRDVAVNKEEKAPYCSRRMSYMLIGVIIVLILGVILGVVFGTDSSGSSSALNSAEGGGNPGVVESGSPTQAPVTPITATLSPTQDRQFHFSSLITDKSLADPALLADESSPESQAMNWLIEADPLSLDPTDTSVRNGLRITQRYALATIFFSSDEQWFNKDGWLNDDECTWFGVTCEGLVITEIDMPENNMDGALSAELAQLGSLRKLILNGNSIKGGIPTSFGAMSRLQVLGLRENALGGELRDVDFSGMINLEVLDLRTNDMKGPIPGSIYTMAALTYFDLEGNALTGTLATEVGNLVNLDRFNVKGTNLDGKIPTEIGQLQAVTVFDISENEFDGPIPAEVGNMQALEEFLANGNALIGNIPAVFGSLPNLEKLRLTANKLTGFIRPELGDALALTELSIESNLLQGTIPDSLGNLVNLKVLHLGRNDFDENAFPDFVYDLQFLVELDLAYCQLTSFLDAAIGDLNSLVILRLHGNYINETVPVEIGNLVNLQVLRLDDNALFGELPTEIGQLVELVDLRVNYNLIEGNIPRQIGNLVNLERFSMGENFFNGQIPDTITQLVKLKIFTCEDNFLSGNLPANIGDMQALQVFRCFLQRFESAKQPGLQGTIPSSIGNLKNLKDLSLYQNGFNGEIPSELGDCESLEVLDLELNSFRGVVPSELGNLETLATLRVGGNDNLVNPLPESVCAIDTLLRYRVSCALDCQCCTQLCGSRVEEDYGTML